ncbi:MAG TPA: DUF3570 domain-containing protein [Patescibacteria group bacterium]|nr:DUF3570 domain-containing protein [Patescibacteria group bacterium]
MIAAGISVLASPAARADDSTLDFKFLHYGEQGGRTQVSNPEIYFTHDFGEKGQVGLLLSYDSISGASPTGEAPTADTTTSASGGASGSIPMVGYQDTRQAISASYQRRFGSNLPSITLSYSHESDYLSRGFSLVDSWELFGGRSTLHAGVGVTSDRIQPVTLADTFAKKGISFSLGWSQVLGPRDLLDFSLGLENLNGYLTDPYKLVTVGASALPEARPDTRSRKSALIKYGHYYLSRSAIKTSYRYYWDDWAIKAHTLELEWDKRLGRRFILAPRLRYYQQGAASFFAYEFSTPQSFMSSDYRLSSFRSWLAGIGMTVEVNDRLSFELAASYLDQTGIDRAKVRPAVVPPLFTLGGVGAFETEEGGEGGPHSLSAADLKTISLTAGFSFKF